MLDELKHQLMDSYRHKTLVGYNCILCNKSDRPFALHIIEYYHVDTIASPKAFIPMSRSRGIIRGSLPICTCCAKPCDKCLLPIRSILINKMKKLIATKYPQINVVSGNGFCRHTHFLHDLLSILRPAKLPNTQVDHTIKRIEKTPISNNDMRTNELSSLDITISDLMAQDAEAIARSEIPTRRLVPHHAIKRDLIIKGYNKDFLVYANQIKLKKVTESEKSRQLNDMKIDFKSKIDGINMMSTDELDKLIILMKKRTDYAELVKETRASKFYPFSEDSI